MGWFGAARERAAAQAAEAERGRRQADFERRRIVEGWRSCVSEPPPALAEVEFLREGEDLPFPGRWEYFPPEFNAAGLWWRPIAPTIAVTRPPAAYSAAGWRSVLYDAPPPDGCVWLLCDGCPEPIAAIPGALRPDLDRARLWRQPRMARLTCAARLPSRSRFPRRALQKALRDYDRGPPPDPF